MACHDLNYTIRRLSQSIDFAEIERNFVHLHKWVNEVKQSAGEMEALEARQNDSQGQNFLRSTLLSVATGAVSPEETHLRICRWFSIVQTQVIDADITRQYQLA